MSLTENQVAVVEAPSSELVQYNSNIPATEERIREIFTQLDVENAGAVRFQEAVEFYLALEHFGLNPTEEDAVKYISKYATTLPEALTYDEFSCVLLSIAQW